MSAEDYIPPLYQDGNGNWVLLDSDGKKYHVATKDSRLGRAIAARTASSAATALTDEELRIAQIYESAGTAYPGDQEAAGILARAALRLARSSTTESAAAQEEIASLVKRLEAMTERWLLALSATKESSNG